MRKSVYLWFERNRWAGDGILAGALLLVMLLEMNKTYDVLSSTPRQLGFAFLTCLPVLLRRILTGPALLLAVAVMLINAAVFGEANTGVALVPIMVHASVAHGSRNWGRLALAFGLVGAVLGPLVWWGRTEDTTLVQVAVALCAAIVVAAFVVGERQRERREFIDEQVRTLTERNRLLANERDQRALIAATNERTRIARELHDIVAHSLSVIVVQADGGAAAVQKRPELAATVLAIIAETSREALREMRGLVGVLRGDGDPADAQYAPAPGIDDLTTLVDTVRQAGLSVELTISGPPQPVSAGLDLTVYRVVQEALTNVLKHAGPQAAAHVRLARSDRELVVTVTDDGRGDAVATDGRGNGLVGMRERVQLLGGSLTAQPRVGGGFVVHAVVPTARIADAARPDRAG